MSDVAQKNTSNNFAAYISTFFTSVATTSVLSNIEINEYLFISSLDIAPMLINIIIFSVLYVPFSYFFNWLYSDSGKNNI